MRCDNSQGSGYEEKKIKPAEKGQIVGGRKVRVRHRALSETEKKSRRQAIAQTILQTMKRMKPKD
jgi:hypothetical protein